jgi:protein required for attachment to host cells
MDVRLWGDADVATYVLVADRARARILRVRGRGSARKLDEVESLVCPTARMQPQELTTERTGRVFARALGGSGTATRARHGAQSDYDPRDAEVERFAGQIVQSLERKRRAAQLDDCVLIAAPRFLGVLRGTIKPTLRRLIRSEVPRDLSRADERRILRAAFPP